MRFRVAEERKLSNAHSPFRVIEQSGREVEWINRFLDQQRVRGVADATLRSYAHDLLHFLRWWATVHKTAAITKEALTESTFLDYIRCQVDQHPAPAAASVNRRVGTAERAMRLEFPDSPPLLAPGFQHWYWRQSRLGYGRLRPALTQLRVKTPKRLIVPLSIEEVHRFWHSFRSSRDLAIVGLMVLHGLRSCEVLALNHEDLQLPELQIRVPGKGKKIRVLPLDRDSVKLLDHYLYFGKASALWPPFIRLSQRTFSRPSHDASRSALFISLSPAIHRREESERPPLSTHVRFRHAAGRY